MAKSETSGDRYRIFAVTMIRNDADVIAPFLAQADELFDKLLVADVQSTDGTKEAVEAYAASTGKAELYTVTKREKYQSALMNCLTRKAFEEGADWVFLIDGDEFINVESREHLERALKAFAGDVMYLPWINLVPSQYGSFTTFDASQQFYWSGRTSPYNKIALSNLFIANNPNFYIHEGNHSVSRDFLSGPVQQSGRDGLPMMHLPIRSADRFKYKIASARKALQTKHNRLPGEGVHVEAIDDLLQACTPFGDRELNAIAANYGVDDAPTDVDPVRDKWPAIGLPRFVQNGPPVDAASLNDTLRKDLTVKWSESSFVRGSQIGAAVNGELISIRPQPMLGSGELYQRRFTKLQPRSVDSTAITPTVLARALEASLIKVEKLTFSAWSELIPALFCIFSIARPRRFVELGTHYGMSYFAACQVTQALETDSTCVAVDNWIGDPHASFHSQEVFDQFTAITKENFADQVYIRANFDHALECFDEGSIDLLHIDGYHTYEAVRNDFETWLPKMSSCGVILFHDINVHERGFGVWRLWEELEQKYPSFGLLHCHGLGMIYVGTEPSVVSEIMKILSDKPEYKQLVQSYLEMVGTLSIDYRRKVEDLHSAGASGQNLRLQQLMDDAVSRDKEIARLNMEYTNRDNEIRSLIDERNQLAFERNKLMDEISTLSGKIDAILSSNSWRATAPMRKVMTAIRSASPARASSEPAPGGQYT